jgi:hypothetical protein
MQHLFYILAIPFLIYEFIWVVAPSERVESALKRLELSIKLKGKKWDEYSEEEQKFLLPKVIFSFYIFIWLILGIFTIQWVLFLAMFAFIFLVIKPLSKLTKENKLAFTILHWLNSIIGLGFVLFVIVNKYHLRIDVWQLVQSWF